MAFARVLRNGLSVDQDDLEILLVDPDLALEVMLAFLNRLRTGLEDVGLEFIDLLPAQVFHVVLRKILSRKDEGQAMLDLVEISG